MTYSAIITLVATLFTTQTFSSKCPIIEWDFNDTPLPSSPIISFLQSKLSLLDSDTPASKMNYDKAVRLLKRHKIGFVWGYGGFRGEPQNAFCQVFESNHSGLLSFTQRLETTPEILSKKLKEISTLRRNLEKETDEEQRKRTERAIARQELKLNALYTAQAKEIELFKEEKICLLGELIARAEKKESDERDKERREATAASMDEEAARRANRSADHPIVLPLNKPLEHLKKDS